MIFALLRLFYEWVTRRFTFTAGAEHMLDALDDYWTPPKETP